MSAHADIELEGYEILDVIGEGAMGRVLEARGPDGNIVAVKVINGAEEDNPMLVERFRREVTVADKIGHPGVPRVFDAGRLADGRFFFVMERLYGVDLEDWWQGDKTRVAAVDVIARSLEPLAAAHEQAIVHRDLKPENIFVEESGGVRLLDFGVARELGEDQKLRTATGIAVGTPVYMSPEQATSPSAVSPASDVWSVGVMLYEAISGALPFDGESLHGIILAACTKPPIPLRTREPDVDPDLEALVHRCIHKAPADRPPDARALRAELDELLSRKRIRESLAGPAARASTLPQTPARPSRPDDTTGPFALEGTEATVRSSPHIPQPPSRMPYVAGFALVAAIGIAGFVGYQPAPSPTESGSAPDSLAAPPSNSAPASTTASSEPSNDEPAIARVEAPELMEDVEPVAEEPNIGESSDRRPRSTRRASSMRSRPRVELEAEQGTDRATDPPEAVEAAVVEAAVVAAATPMAEASQPNPNPAPRPATMDTVAPIMRPRPNPARTTKRTTMRAQPEPEPERPGFVTF